MVGYSTVKLSPNEAAVSDAAFPKVLQTSVADVGSDSGEAPASQRGKRPYLHRFVDRHGHERLYLRRAGAVSITLPHEDAPGFEEAYAAALAVSLASTPRKARTTRLERFRTLAEKAVTRAHYRDIARGRVSEITADWMLAQIGRQNLRCALTGIPFAPPDRDSAWSKNPYAPSLDRIDCSKGYEIGNVRVVLLAVNVALNEWGEDVFREIAAALVAKPKKRPAA